MKIASIKIKNFRGYGEEVEIKFDDLTVFVGKNDVNIEEIQKGNSETIISVCFDELPNEIIIDSTVKTTKIY